MNKAPSIFTANHGFVEERDCLDGKQWLFRYPNGYGASVVRHRYSYGGTVGFFELAVIRWEKDTFDLVYSTPITKDVLGWQTGADILATLDRIAAL